MKIKSLIKSVPTLNSRANYEFYRLFSRKSDAFNQKLDLLGSIDCIQDVSALEQFRAAIDSGECFYTTDANRSNSIIYGIWDSIFGSVADYPVYRLPAVEHGLIFPAQQFTDTLFTARPSLVTFGRYRYEILRSKVRKPVFMVGPYIAYAEPYYDKEKRNKLKKKNGRTLQVLPAHGTDESGVTRAQDSDIAKVRMLAKDYQTVIVNAFWWNINDPIIKKFAAEGYHISSAGFRDDVRFLSRLRTLIELADLVVGDDVGTHVGYTLALGVPYHQIPLGTSVDPPRGVSQYEYRRVEGIKSNLGSLFLEANEILSDQVEVCEPFWGFSCLRSREELKAIAEISAHIGELSHDWSLGFARASKHALREYEESDLMKYVLLSEALR